MQYDLDKDMTSRIQELTYENVDTQPSAHNAFLE